MINIMNTFVFEIQIVKAYIHVAFKYITVYSFQTAKFTINRKLKQRDIKFFGVWLIFKCV